MSDVSLEKRKSEIQSLLELQPSSVEGLQDKLKLLLEEWSKEEQVYVCTYHVCSTYVYLTHTHTHTYTHTHTHTHTHAYCIRTHMCTHTVTCVILSHKYSHSNKVLL